MKGYRKYFLNKLAWFLVTFVCAFLLNFILPRLMPGDPVAAIVSQAGPGHEQCDRGPGDLSAIYRTVWHQQTHARTIFPLCEKCGAGRFWFLVQPISQNGGRCSQIFHLVDGVPAVPGDHRRLADREHTRRVGSLSQRGFDKVLMPVSIFVSNFPAFGMAVILLVIFGVNLKWFPTSGGYGFDLIPNFSWQFIWSVIVHYQLPFWSIVLIAIGGQAIGMRSMSIYELNADYVKYSRFMGIKDRKIVGYVFRNAMLPQITGLALSIGTMVGGALVAEIIFSYPGLGITISDGCAGTGLSADLGNHIDHHVDGADARTLSSKSCMASLTRALKRRSRIKERCCYETYTSTSLSLW